MRAQAQGSHHLRNTALCTSGGTTYVGNVIVNNHTYVIDSSPTDLPLVLGLHLLLNQETSGPDGVIETALTVTLNGSPLVVIAQAEVGTGCGDEG